MHLPKATLQAGRFRGVSRFGGVGVIRERKVTKNNAQTRAIIALELVDQTGNCTAGRTLEVPKLLQSDRRIAFTTDVNLFAAILTREGLIFWAERAGRSAR